jgi:hypothetical protein
MTYKKSINESKSFYQKRDGYDKYQEGHQLLTITQYEGNYACLETERWAVTPDDLRELANVLEKWLAETSADQEEIWAADDLGN